jgi:hypothetical protein
MAKASRHLDVHGRAGIPEPAAQIANGRRALLAALIRELYYRERRLTSPKESNAGRTRVPNWDGGTTSTGAQKKNIWPDIADIVIQHRMDPWVFVRLQFSSGRDNPALVPEPSVLKTDLAVERYQAFMADVVPRLASEYRNSCVSLATRLRELERLKDVTPERRLITALHDESNVHAPSLFRYCSAPAGQPAAGRGTLPRPRCHGVRVAARALRPSLARWNDSRRAAARGCPAAQAAGVLRI